MKEFNAMRDLTDQERANLGASELRALAREAEAMRFEEVRARGMVPDECGPEIPVAPARGPVRVFESRAFYPKGAEEFEVRRAGHMGRKTMARADAFDVMGARAKSRNARQPFTSDQIAIARHYRDLVERHAAAGVKCSSLEGRGGGGGGGGFMDAVLRDREEIDRLRTRVGGGVAIEVRRVRPSERGSRRAIPDLALVDMVCIEDKTVSDALKAFGWSATGKNIAAARKALAASFDRMMGPVRHRNVGFMRLDGAAHWPGADRGK